MCAAQSPAKMLQFLAAFRRLSIYTKFTCLDVGHINSMVQWSYSGNSKAIEARNEALNEAPDGNGNSAVSLCLVSHEAGLMYHQAGHFSRPTSATGRIIPIIRMFFLGTNHAVVMQVHAVDQGYSLLWCYGYTASSTRRCTANAGKLKWGSSVSRKVTMATRSLPDTS